MENDREGWGVEVGSGDGSDMGSLMRRKKIVNRYWYQPQG